VYRSRLGPRRGTAHEKELAEIRSKALESQNQGTVADHGEKAPGAPAILVVVGVLHGGGASTTVYRSRLGPRRGAAHEKELA